uniref:RRM domain-containing protein n=1 Tax=Megaselia scalaris TaxID=36166 RepID=T1GWR8_MEGSC
MSKNGTIVPGLQKSDAKLPPEVVNRIEGQSPQQVIKTYDPKLSDNNLPEYPALPSHYDSRKIEEIRRTIIVCDVKNEWRLDDLMDLFSRAGEVKYARWADKDGKTFCMIEFCEQYSVINALKMQGQEFKNGYLNLYHATDAIVKPEAKSNEVAQREIEEAMSIVKEAQSPGQGPENVVTLDRDLEEVHVQEEGPEAENVLILEDLEVAAVKG